MDYYVEFYDNSDNLFCEFAKKQARLCPYLLEYRGISLEELIIWELYMFGLFVGWKEKYNEERLNGISANVLMEDFSKQLDARFAWSEKETQHVESYSTENEEWKNALSEYKNQPIIYLFNERQLNYLMPLIQKIPYPIVLLCDFDISESIEFPDSVSIIEFGISPIFIYRNEYLGTKFPIIYHYVNTFEQIVSGIGPTGIIFLEGCHLQAKTLNIVARGYNVKTICIQQGWPSFMHTQFRRYAYDYFLTWGKLFNTLWKKYDPSPTYIECGYMYEIKKQKDKHGVTFFLQSPVFLSDTGYFQEILCLIELTSKRHPDIPILIREHPEYKINNLWRERLEKFKNIQFVGDFPIADVYGNTLVAVSHFSSCIMEALIHNCIPLVFNPTYNSRYYPDIEKMGFGLISKEQNDFLTQIETLLLDKERQSRYFNNITKEKKTMFVNIADDTINEIVKQINKRFAIN